MTQSKNNLDVHELLDFDEVISDTDYTVPPASTISVSLDDTSGTFTLSDIISDVSTITLDNNTIDWSYTDNRIDPTRVEKMCKHYPALEKAWQNFFSIYKMVDQDYKGNYEDLDDDIPF